MPPLVGLASALAMLIGWPVTASHAETPAPLTEPPQEPPSAPAAPASAAPADEGTPAAQAPTAEAAPASGGRTRSPGADVGLDLNVEGALGWVPQRDHFTGFARARVGLLVFFEPLDPRASQVAISTGMTYDISDLSGATLGLQTELIHLSSGLWGQAGAMVDVITPSPVMMVSLGWSLIGVEVQRRLYDVDHVGSRDDLNDFGLYAKLRVPISIIMRAF